MHASTSRRQHPVAHCKARISHSVSRGSSVGESSSIGRHLTWHKKQYGRTRSRRFVASRAREVEVLIFLKSVLCFLEVGSLLCEAWTFRIDLSHHVCLSTGSTGDLGNTNRGNGFCFQWDLALLKTDDRASCIQREPLPRPSSSQNFRFRLSATQKNDIKQQPNHF